MAPSTRTRGHGPDERDDIDLEMRAFVRAFMDEAGHSHRDLLIRPVPADGSSRLFWRISCPESDASYVAMENRPDTPFKKRENIAYLEIGRHLFKKGLPVPEIHRSDLTSGRFILEDMGETSLQQSAARDKDKIPRYQQVVDILIRLQTEGAKGFEEAWTCQTKRYDRSVMRPLESDYFRDAFLNGYLGLKKEWPELERPFDHIASMASRADNGFFLHRDFQSRNIYVSKGRIGILDWQGGRFGPLAYDLASLLVDPYTALSARERDRVFQYYLDLLQDMDPKGIEPFLEFFPYIALQRNLQILGAFSYLTKAKKKAHFEPFISPALVSLHGFLNDLKDPPLSALLDLVKSLLNA